MLPKVTKGPTALKLRYAALLFLSVAFPALLRAQQTYLVPSTAYPTIQSGINAASTGDTVLVSPGTYLENIDFKDKGLKVTSQSGNPVSATIIDGNGGGPVVTITGASSVGAQLAGFTIQNGGKPQTSGGPQGGIYISNTVATIGGNTIVKAFCAGINSVGATVVLDSNDISQTLTAGCGATEGLGSGIAMTGSYAASTFIPLISSNILHNNTASVSFSADKGGGGAINVTNMPAVNVVLNKMYANTTTGYGGAFYIATTPQLTFENNLVYGNKGVSGGLDIVVPGSSVGPLVGIIANNTIADNTAVGSNAGSDIYISGNLAQYALVNNIVVGYTNGQVAVNCGTSYQSQTLTPLIIDHNDFYSVPGSSNTPIGGFCTTPPTQLGNFSKDPLFVHGTAADVNGTSGNAVDFSLQTGSPAIDTGNNSATTVSSQDVAANPRIQNGGGAGGLSYAVVDMGAYEHPTAISGAVSATIISLSPSSYTPPSNGPVTLTATIQTQTGSSASTPTGSVNFLEDYAVVGSGVITANGTSGTATIVLHNLAPGLHNLQAVYAGQGAFPPGISIDVILSATVGITTQTSTTIASSLPNGSNVGQSVTFSANVSSSNGVPPGQMVFTADMTTLGTFQVDTSGNASVSTSTLAAGTHIITAAYLPSDTTYATSSASLTQKVNAGPSSTTTTLTSSLNPSGFGQQVTFSATVSPGDTDNGLVTGTVSFYDGATLLATQAFGQIGCASCLPDSRTAQFSTSTLSIGSHAMKAVFTPTGSFLTSTGTMTQVVEIGTTATLTVNPTTLNYGDTTKLTATIAAIGAPVGSPTPTGTVTFFDGTAVLATAPLVSPTATFTTPALPSGTHNFTCTYSGDTVYAPSQCNSVPATVGAEPTTLIVSGSSANPSPALTPVTFSAQLLAGTTPVVGVTVTFHSAATSQLNGIIGGTTQTGVTNAQGIATATYTGFYPGQYNLTASFAGNATDASSTSTAYAEAVNINPTSMTLLASPNPGVEGATVTFVATVAATIGIAPPIGTVTILDGATPLTTLTLIPGNGTISSASFSTTTLAAGTHSLTASYTPAASFDQPFQPTQTTSALSLLITTQSFTLTTDTPNISIQTEHHGAMTLTVTPVGSFNGFVALSCSSTLPPVLQCEFAHAQLSVNNSATSSKLTLETDAIDNFYGAAAPQRGHNKRNEEIALAALLPLALLSLTKRRRLAKAMVFSTLFALLSTLCLTGCSGKQPDHTPPGTYDVALTASGTPAGTSTPVTKTIHLTVTVTP